MEEKDRMIATWAQEDVETLDNLLNNNNIFFPENRVFYEIMWKNIIQPDRPQMTMWRMRIAC